MSNDGPATYDMIDYGDNGWVRITWVSPRGEAWVDEGWTVPVEYLVNVRTAVRGGLPAVWRVSPEWTEATG